MGTCQSLLIALLLSGGPESYFAIEVVDEATGRGVPLVELETVDRQVYVTDSHGLIAMGEPELMNRVVFFQVRGHGYEFPADGFGFRGTKLEVEAGGRARIAVRRVNVAERLYRVTGGGIYRDTILLGRPAPLEHPVLNAQVMGSDSVVCAPYRGRIYWFWGDTNRPSYPLGNFHVPGATSLLPSQGGLDPSVGVNLDYFVGPDGFARPTAQMPGEGPTWIGSLVVLRESDGSEQMFAHYVKVRNFLEVYEWGLVRWNDESNSFEKENAFSLAAPVRPVGAHTFQHRDLDGTEYVYFAHPYPYERVRATVEALQDEGQYEAFTCLQAGSTLERPVVDRDAQGRVRYAWRRNAPALDHETQQRLIRQRKLQPDERLRWMRDVQTGEEVVAHRGSVYWNAYRKRWVMIFHQSGGRPSHLGEVWYAEADAPTGPWLYARRIVTHDKYTFYNPKQHPFFDQEEGRTVYFEGTYTQSFSHSPRATPRYDYNQVMYRLDLADDRLNLPVVVTGSAAEVGDEAVGTWSGFCAWQREAEGSVACYVRTLESGKRIVTTERKEGEQLSPWFYGLPVAAIELPACMVPLYEFIGREDGRLVYGTWTELPGYRKAEAPLCLVWEQPLNVRLPDRSRAAD